MASPKKNVAYSFDVMLPESAAPGKYKSNPTLAAGDVKITSDEGALANLTTLPTVSPAAGRNVKVSVSQTEMNADRISIVFSDQTVPQEWDDVYIFIETNTATMTDIDGRLPAALTGAGNIKADTLAVGGTTQTARDLGASVLLSSGTGAGQVSLSSGTVTVGTNNDKTGYGLSSAAVQAIWDAATTALSTVGSIGKYLLDHLVGTLAAGTHTAQTGDAYARLGAPVGASVSADIASVQSDTDDLQTRLPAALVGGRMDASVGAMEANTVTADAIATNAIDADALAADAVTEIQAGLSTLNAAQVNAEVVDALATDVYAEPGQGTPAATTSLAAKLNYLYKAWRNRSTQSSTTYSLYADDGTTVDQKSAVSDNGTTYDRGEVATGP